MYKRFRIKNGGVSKRRLFRKIKCLCFTMKIASSEIKFY